MKKKRIMGPLLGTGIALLVIFITFLFPKLYSDFENKTYDLRFFLKVGPPGIEDIDDVVLIDIDEKSVAELGRFQQWPRLYHAKIIDELTKGGASAIGFDILFLESDSLRPEIISLYEETKATKIALELAESLKIDLPPEKSAMIIRQVLNASGFDADLSEIVKESNNVYFGYYFGTGGESEVSDESIERFAFSFDSQVTEAYSYLHTPEGLNFIGNVGIPLREFCDASRGIGFVNVEQDDDGVVRALPLFLSYRKKCYPALALQMVLDKLGVSREKIKVVLGKYVDLAGRKILIDDEGRMLINYIGSYRKFRYISYSDLLLGQVPLEYFKDKIVIVGTSLAGLFDLRAVPFSPNYPGMEIHANVAYNILKGNFMVKTPFWISLICVFGLAILAGLIAYLLGALRGGLLIVTMVLVYLIVAYFLFAHSGIWIEVIRPIVSLFLTYLVVMIYRYVTEERRKLQIKGMFQQYMSKELVNKLLEKPEMLKLGGERKEVTVVFSDIQAFTTIAEQMTPEELVSLINEYLTAMTDVILEYGGYVDKYEGDAIMAFWGAPVDQADHASRAIRCVLALREKLKEINVSFTKRGKPTLFTRWGVNTGEAIVGNMGSKEKFAYTALGDEINLGSRLEGANKEYKTQIMISESTCEKVKNLVIVRDLGWLTVKGKTKPERVFELLASKEKGLSIPETVMLEHYHRGLKSFLERRWDDGISAFQEALGINSEDGPSKTYLERCLEFKETPPPSDWDGTFVMKTK
ncbi:MAG: adenylate/guanylate cyclase domain-containing protein [Candidatus Edwardsbacteria bacterium]